jgi:branched-chain amino acid transport system permease protein
MNSVKSGSDLTLKKIAPPAVTVLALIALGFFPLFNASSQPSYIIVLSVSVLMYIVMSVSWNIFSGPTGYISLATAAFFGVGIYTSALFGANLPLPVLMLIGGTASFALALIIGAVTLRLHGVYFTIFTFGLVLLLQSLILWYEIKFSGTRGRTVVPVDYVTVFYCMFGVLVLLLLAAYLVKRSRFGMALTSIGECEDAASHVGVNTTVVKVLAFAGTAFAMGAVGAAKATTMIYVDPPIAFNVLMSFMPVLMVIFGGSGYFFGPVIGAVIFTILQEQLTTKWPKWYMIIFGSIMVLAILFLPNGLVGAMKEITGIAKKMIVVLATCIFVAFGYAFNLILASSGVAIGGLVFPLLFGIVGFMISVQLMKYLIGKAKKEVGKNADT